MGFSKWHFSNTINHLAYWKHSVDLLTLIISNQNQNENSKPQTCFICKNYKIPIQEDVASLPDYKPQWHHKSSDGENLQLFHVLSNQACSKHGLSWRSTS